MQALENDMICLLCVKHLMFSNFGRWTHSNIDAWIFAENNLGHT